MRSPFRNRRAAAKVADLHTALTVSEAMRRDSEARQREAAAKRAADARDHLETIIDGIATDFYVASAIHTWSAPNRHQVGVMERADPSHVARHRQRPHRHRIPDGARHPPG